MGYCITIFFFVLLIFQMAEYVLQMPWTLAVSCCRYLNGSFFFNKSLYI